MYFIHLATVYNALDASSSPPLQSPGVVSQHCMLLLTTHLLCWFLGCFQWLLTLSCATGMRSGLSGSFGTLLGDSLSSADCFSQHLLSIKCAPTCISFSWHCQRCFGAFPYILLFLSTLLWPLPNSTHSNNALWHSVYKMYCMCTVVLKI